ncbi:MAG: carbohydrate-binding family 9-like protein [Candidatus Cloacimonetes bacterium]|nr:carbohydrate-binding family 9-like protein [Candidatus Cloacimonadota bacterium]HOH60034.1 carbohydrate-binding family 9-like protein [Candidatus Cloacimonadota bacterium]HPI25696.1 carbohydrate-binding family 9-like protein [Candidatus Cloacimonadota bacterium]
MFRYILILFILSVVVLSAETFPVPVGAFAPRQYTAFRPIDDIVIDGILREASWQKALWSEDFVDIEGDLKPLPFLHTRVKMLWDEDWLFFAAELEEPHIWAKLTERDAVIFHDNDFEIFIDPDGDTHDYYELEVNAQGTLWDLLIIKPYRDRDKVAVNAWDIRGIQYAIGIDGTLNNPSDIDKAWRVELKIPMSTLSECANKLFPPSEGDFWRINFSRVHWDTDVIDGEYVKIAGKPEYNWVWSPQGLIAMHYPERWGYLFFSKAEVGSGDPVVCSYRPLEYLREYLRQLYYQQKQYYFDHGKYAKTLRQLKAKPPVWAGKKLKLKLESHSKGYIITLSRAKDQPNLYIREDGLIWSDKD